jgi:hypothetical protein
MRDGRPEYEGCALSFRALERDRRLAILKDRKLPLERRSPALRALLASATHAIV